MICSSMCLTSNSSGVGERSFSEMTSGWFTGSPSSARWMITILCRGTCSVQSSKRSMLSIANHNVVPLPEEIRQTKSNSLLHPLKNACSTRFSRSRILRSSLPMYTSERLLTRFLSRTLEWMARGMPIERGVWTVC